MNRGKRRARVGGSRSRPSPPGEKVKRAVELLQQGRLDEADALLRQSLRQDPDQVDALHFLGVLAAKRGRPEEGVELIRRALAQNPYYVDALNNLGNLLLTGDRVDEAVAAYRRAIALAPDHANAHANLGIALRRSGKLPEAVAALRQATALEPRHAIAHYHLAKLLADLGRYEEAVAAYREAIRADPSHVPSHDGLAALLHDLGRGEEAAALYRQWLDRDPGSPVARHMLAANSGGDPPGRAADEYVRELFDGMADGFDRHLNTLEYRAPEWIARAVAAVLGAPERSLAVLDAGCGTGLCGPFLRPYARRLEGVDLSSRMVERARERGGYDELVVAELTAFLTARHQAYDLIASADTLVYFGELATVCAAAAGALRPGGWLVFTAELPPDPPPASGFHLQRSGRYSHSEGYVRGVLESAGMVVASLEAVDLRREGGRPVAGLLVASHTAPASA